jgi:hypothetical protein
LRERSIPPKYWDGFLQDAHAVPKLLYKKHIEYNKAGATVPAIVIGVEKLNAKQFGEQFTLSSGPGCQSRLEQYFDHVPSML